MMKKCSRCEVERPEDGFYIRKSGIPNRICKECFKAATNARYHGPKNAELKEQFRKWGVDYRQRNRDAAFKAYGGYVCACCGETEQKFLTLDHVNNDGAEFRRMIRGNRQAAGATTYAWLARNGFPSGYQVLCMNCNHGKRMNNGVCPHQVRCNDHPRVGVGPSGPKRIAPAMPVEDMVSSSEKSLAA